MSENKFKIGDKVLIKYDNERGLFNIIDLDISTALLHNGLYKMTVPLEMLELVQKPSSKEIIEPQPQDKAMRFNEGKLRWSLLDFDALEGLVKVLEFGAKKYDDNNWKKGQKTTDIIDSMMRHLKSYLSGEDLDPESGLPHVDHIMCNAMFLSYMNRFMPEMDTRYKNLLKNEGLDLNNNNE